MLLAVTAVPLEVTAAFQEFTMAWLPPQVHVTFQVLVATVPLLVTVIVAVRPLPHWLSTWKAAVQVAVPDAGGVGVAVLTGVGLAAMTGVGLAVLTGVGVAVLTGVGVAVLTGVGVAVLTGVGVAVLTGVGLAVLTGVGLAVGVWVAPVRVGVGVWPLVGTAGKAFATSWSN
jgi:hypothetical protein